MDSMQAKSSPYSICSYKGEFIRGSHSFSSRIMRVFPILQSATLKWLNFLWAEWFCYTFFHVEAKSLRKIIFEEYSATRSRPNFRSPISFKHCLGNTKNPLVDFYKYITEGNISAERNHVITTLNYYSELAEVFHLPENLSFDGIDIHWRFLMTFNSLWQSFIDINCIILLCLLWLLWINVFIRPKHPCQ